MTHLKLWSTSVLMWTQVTSETSVWISNNFRDVLTPPYCQDVIQHIQMIETACVNWVRAQATCKSCLFADKQWLGKAYSFFIHLFSPHWLKWMSCVLIVEAVIRDWSKHRMMLTFSSVLVYQHSSSSMGWCWKRDWDFLISNKGSLIPDGTLRPLT